MSVRSTGPPAPEQQQPLDDSIPQGVERFGPLELQRYLKPDGRALILFRRAEPADEEQ